MNKTFRADVTDVTNFALRFHAEMILNPSLDVFKNRVIILAEGCISTEAPHLVCQLK